MSPFGATATSVGFVQTRLIWVEETVVAERPLGEDGVVYPAALMPRFAHEAGATVVDVNPERDALTASATIFLKGPGGEVLPLLVAAVKDHLGD